jgi:hypothetical protein
MKDQPSSVPNPPQSSTIVTEKSSNIQEAQLPSKQKHPQISVVVMKLPKARFVGADGKLSLARGIPIPLPDHVVSIKPTSADPAPSVVSECPSAHVQPSAHAPSIDPIVVRLLVLGLLLHVLLRVLLRLILAIYSTNSNPKRLPACRSMHLSPQVRLKTYFIFWHDFIVGFRVF